MCDKLLFCPCQCQKTNRNNFFLIEVFICWYENLAKAPDLCASFNLYVLLTKYVSKANNLQLFSF